MAAIDQVIVVNSVLSVTHISKGDPIKPRLRDRIVNLSVTKKAVEFGHKRANAHAFERPRVAIQSMELAQEILADYRVANRSPAKRPLTCMAQDISEVPVHMAKGMRLDHRHVHFGVGISHGN